MLILVMCKTFQQAFISSDLVYLCIQLYSWNFEPRGRQFLIGVPYLAGISYDLILTNFIQLYVICLFLPVNKTDFSALPESGIELKISSEPNIFLTNALIHSVLYPVDQ